MEYRPWALAGQFVLADLLFNGTSQKKAIYCIKSRLKYTSYSVFIPVSNLEIITDAVLAT